MYSSNDILHILSRHLTLSPNQWREVREFLTQNPSPSELTIHLVERKWISPEKASEILYVFSIVRIHGPHIVKALIPYLKSEIYWRRMLAISALGKMEDSEAKWQGKGAGDWLMDRLEELSDDFLSTDENRREAEALVWALGELRWQKANELIHKVRLKSGVYSTFWTNTQIPYKKIPVKENRKPSQKAESWLSLGERKYNKEKYKEAVADFNRALAMNPKSTRAYILRGMAYQEYCNRAMVYIKEKKFSLAVKDFEKYLQLQPRAPNAAGIRRFINKYK